MQASRSPAFLYGETIAWLALAAGMWIYSYQYDGDFEAFLWGPVAWPRAAMVGIVVLAIAHLVTQTMLHRRAQAAPADAAGTAAAVGAQDDDEEHGPGARARIIATFCLPLLYLLLLPHTGYFATTPLFLIAYMIAFRERNWGYMIVTALGLYLASLLIFAKLLFVPLPTGTLPGFYDFSNWLLDTLEAL